MGLSEATTQRSDSKVFHPVLSQEKGKPQQLIKQLRLHVRVSCVDASEEKPFV